MLAMFKKNSLSSLLSRLANLSAKVKSAKSEVALQMTKEIQFVVDQLHEVLDDSTIKIETLSKEDLKNASYFGDEVLLVKLLKKVAPSQYPYFADNFPLIEACRKGQLSVVKLLLKNEQISAHAACDKNRALRAAGAGNFQDIVDTLLKVRSVQNFFLSIEGYDEERLNRTRLTRWLESAVDAKQVSHRKSDLQEARTLLFSGLITNAEQPLLALAIKAKDPQMISCISTFPSIRAKVHLNDLNKIKKALRERTTAKLVDEVVLEPSKHISIKIGSFRFKKISTH